MGLLVTFIHTHYLSTHDLAIFEQSFWMTIHQGGFFTNTVDTMYHCSFGAHNSPILLALVPFYLIFQHPLLFYYISTLLLGLAAIPLFYICKSLFDNRLSFLLVLIYLLSPAIHGINLYNFSVVCFVPLLFFSCWYGLISNRWKLYLISGLTLILVREDVALLPGMIGVYGLFFSKNRGGIFKITHLILIIFALLFTILSITVVIPYFASSSSLSSNYIQNFVDNFTPYGKQRVVLFAETFLPLLFIPFAAPEILLVGMFQFLEVFLSPAFSFLDIQYHYPGMFQPVIILATVYGLLKISRFLQVKDREFLFKYIQILLFSSSIISFLIISPFISYSMVVPDYLDQAHKDKYQYLDSIIAHIPGNAAIVTQDNVIPHLAGRIEAFQYGYHPDADYVIIETGTGYAKYFEPDLKKYQGWIPLIKKNEIVVLSNPRKPYLQEYLLGL
nr:DUF2079 domain-containing protein [Methanospirillum sp.]